MRRPRRGGRSRGAGAVEAAHAAVEATGGDATTQAAESMPAADRPDDDDDDDDGDDDDDRWATGRHGKKHGKCKGKCGKHHGHCGIGTVAMARRPLFCSGELCLQPKLRLRLRYDAIEQDPTVDYIGRNNGFGLSSGRLGLGASTAIGSAST